MEEELRKAFQAGERFGAITYGTAESIDGEKPLNEDAYVGKTLRELAARRVVELVEGRQPTTEDIVRLGKESLQRNHPGLYEELVARGEIVE